MNSKLVCGVLFAAAAAVALSSSIVRADDTATKKICHLVQTTCIA
jgi:hypothetical protein